MLSLSLILDKLQGFLQQGGEILVVIMFTTFFLWMLILERHYFFQVTLKTMASRMIVSWNRRYDKQSWNAHQIRLQLISLVKIKCEQHLSTIKLVVVIAPLLGLLGTVTGMIDVFDVMASTGANNARGMAAGVSKATIPTMAGMVVSLSGLLFSVSLQRRAQRSIEHLANQLLIKEAK